MTEVKEYEANAGRNALSSSINGVETRPHRRRASVVPVIPAEKDSEIAI